MRRSQIDTIIDETKAIMARHGQVLPPYAAWTPAQWRTRALETRLMRERGLGWNVATFKADAFAESGIVVFTTRMGDHKDLAGGRGKLYGEKIFVCRDGQRVPYHYHRVKTEDVVNRGGGSFIIDLLQVDENGQPTDLPFELDRDGIRIAVPARASLRLEPGEGLTLDPLIAHAFRAEGSDVVCGEVSLANDDATDNYFLEPLPDQAVSEDAPARYCVVADYSSF